MSTYRVFNRAKILVLAAFIISGGVSITTVVGIAGIVTTVVEADRKTIFGVDAVVSVNEFILAKYNRRM